jgi:hypothetical protein
VGNDRDEVGFEDALADLKRNGCAILVVGSVPPDAYHRVSRRMLGDASAGEERRRLLVVPDADRPAAVERLRESGRTDPSHAWVVTCNGTARSAAASAGSSADLPAIRRVETSFVDLGEAITDSIERFRTVSGGLAPAELRVGVDALSALDADDTRAAFGFLHVLGAQVRRARGMAHVRLAREFDARETRTLAPLFDAVVELRLDGYRLEQRWHLDDRGVVSDWLPVDDPGDGG